MTESSAKRVAVVGAASQIGRALLPRLEAEGIHVFRIGRENRKDDGATTYVFDEQRECFTPPVDSADAVISLAPLPSIDLVLKMAAALGAKRIIAFGSTPDLRKRAIIWGTFGAIAVRTAMTLVVVWLLKVPGLMLLGGALLVWIAYKLLADNDSDGHEVSAASSFWGAMKTIVVADAVMGLDNVLAVAGAAHGSFLLVVIGLLISIPIVIWGSQIILKWVERFPSIVYIGSGVLAWTAAKMILGEPLIKEFVAANPAFAWLTYIVIMGGVLGGGFLWNHTVLMSRPRS